MIWATQCIEVVLQLSNRNSTKIKARKDKRHTEPHIIAGWAYCGRLLHIAIYNRHTHDDCRAARRKHTLLDDERSEAIQKRAKKKHIQYTHVQLETPVLQPKGLSIQSAFNSRKKRVYGCVSNDRFEIVMRSFRAKTYFLHF